MNTVIKQAVGNQAQAASALARLIGDQLRAGKRVLWLISGGSSQPIACMAANTLALQDCSNLLIGMIDDFFDLASKKPTNYRQLLDLGLELSNAPLQPIIQDGLTATECGKAYDAVLREWLATTDYAIGQFGIGAGYHTGGILPKSPAATERTKLAMQYELGGTERITVTPALITRLDVAFINSFGSVKRPLIKHFLSSNASIDAEPTQALKTADSCLLYSDVILELAS